MKILLKFLILLKCVRALEATVSVSPDTVGSTSTFSIDVLFDESLGAGGVISIQIPDDNIDANALNRGLTFDTSAANPQCIQMSHTLPVLQGCTVENSKHLKITLAARGFVRAGQNIQVRITNVTKNPSSTWWSTKSLQVSTWSANMQ